MAEDFYLRVQLTESILVADDVAVFVPAGSLGSVVIARPSSQLVEVRFDNAILSGDADGLRVAAYILDVKPEQLRAVNR